MSGQKTLDRWPGSPGIHAIAEQLGIPAATLAGLRDGSLVAVPRKPTEAMLAAGRLARPYREDDGDPVTMDSNSELTWEAMLAAAQDRTP